MAKSNSEFKSIQKKLVAAVAMVLVASIMVVSSSYAWFTLSTAPEVKGIQTSVGSNGNLEMALRDDQYDLNSIPTGSQVNMPEANINWGNLVDLSYNGEYGLDKITLQPSRLLWTDDQKDTINNSGYLSVPTYGVDGRISGWNNVSSGKLTNGQFLAGTSVGVRGLGTISGLSAGQVALRSAITEMTTSRDKVGSMARNSLEVDAINLANLMISNKMAGKTEVEPAEWAQVVAAVTNLEAIATKLESTMDTVVNAVAVSKNVDISGKEITYSAAGAAVDGVDFSDLADLQAGLGKAYVTLYGDDTSNNTGIWGKVNAAKAVINDASTYPQNQFSTVDAVMRSILSTNNIEIDGNNFGDMGRDQMIETVFTAYSENDGKLPLNIVSGIYKEIADFIGNYSAQKRTPISLVGTQYETDSLKSVNVTLLMKVETEAPEIKPAAGETPAVKQFYLSYFVTQLNLLEAHDAGGDTSSIISDLYAYAVDLAFRTNAQTSNLMLQTTAVSRVGDDSTPAVQGGGSYMQFTKSDDDAGYTIEQMRDLMGAVRVVLYNTETNEIYAVAALDMTAAETNNDVVKAPLYLYEISKAGSEALTLGNKKDVDNKGRSMIAELQQNTVLALTALVYLDGDVVDNTDVAINGNSMTGTLNLQFSSSAELKPMDYTFNENQTPNTPATPTTTPATTPPVPETSDPDDTN